MGMGLHSVQASHGGHWVRVQLSGRESNINEDMSFSMFLDQNVIKLLRNSIIYRTYFRGQEWAAFIGGRWGL